MELIFKQEVYDIIGACYEVYKHLSCGFYEAVYHEALEIEFESRGIPFESEKILPIYYKGQLLRKHYRPDFFCYDNIIVELKAVDTITTEHVSQLLNYLHASKSTLGLLVNFGCKDKIEWRRYINTVDNL